MISCIGSVPEPLHHRGHQNLKIPSFRPRWQQQQHHEQLAQSSTSPIFPQVETIVRAAYELRRRADARGNVRSQRVTLFNSASRVIIQTTSQSTQPTKQQSSSKYSRRLPIHLSCRRSAAMTVSPFHAFQKRKVGDVNLRLHPVR
jgi:hypothetical protein